MKRFNTILSILVFFLFSFNVNAQVGQASRAETDNIAIPNNNASSALCNTYEDVDIEITDVEWNVAGNYHVVHLDFNKPGWFTTVNTTEPYVCDVTVRLFGTNDLPIKFIYQYAPSVPNEPIYTNGDLTGFRIFPDPHTGGGIGTEAGLMGRVGVNAGSRPCVQIIETNADCVSTYSEMDVYCDDPGGKEKVVQTAEQNINAYPSPAQNNLFIETNDLDVKAVNMMSLYGQTVSNKIAIHYHIDKMQINTTQLESGIYLIVLETASGTLVKKVMIQKD